MKCCHWLLIMRDRSNLLRLSFWGWLSCLQGQNLISDEIVFQELRIYFLLLLISRKIFNAYKRPLSVYNKMSKLLWILIRNA